MREFTTIFWDVDGTLLDFAYSERCALTQCFRTIGKEITEEIIQRYSEINDSYWKKLERNEITREKLLTERFLALFREFNIEDVDVEAFRLEFQKGLANIYAFLDDSLTICNALHGRVKQYVVTNGVTATQKNKLKLSGLAEIMDGLFISEEVGAPKPQKEFFDYCLEHVEEKDRSKILIVGDSLSSDIKGGINAGLVTCWYRPDDTENPTGYNPDYEISDLHRIYDILNVFG